jgi:four helix bundle protein
MAPYEKLLAWQECRRDSGRFLDISLASLTEVGYALRLAREAGFLPDTDWAKLDDQHVERGFLLGNSTNR